MAVKKSNKSSGLKKSKSNNRPKINKTKSKQKKTLKTPKKDSSKNEQNLKSISKSNLDKIDDLFKKNIINENNYQKKTSSLNNITKDYPKSIIKDKIPTPTFISVNEKNLRNNFGNAMKRKDIVQNQLNLLNERLRDRNMETKPSIISHFNQYKPIKNNKTIKIFIYAIITLVVILVFLSIYLLINNHESYVDEGICSVRIQTIEDGRIYNIYNKLQDTECNINEDCKLILSQQGYSDSDIRSMRIKCIQK
jgi:hypothetical protein